jgi:hypothetical protein
MTRCYTTSWDLTSGVEAADTVTPFAGARPRSIDAMVDSRRAAKGRGDGGGSEARSPIRRDRCISRRRVRRSCGARPDAPGRAYCVSDPRSRLRAAPAVGCVRCAFARDSLCVQPGRHRWPDGRSVDVMRTTRCLSGRELHARCQRPRLRSSRRRTRQGGAARRDLVPTRRQAAGAATESRLRLTQCTREPTGH